MVSGILKKLLTGIVLIHLSAYAQKENRFIRSGNDNFFGGNFKEAEVDYMKGLERSPESVKGQYNLGGALYKQENFEDAARLYGSVGTREIDANTRADAFYNLGNTFLKSQKLNEAIESYKNALRLNPHDEDARYNLEYARRLQQEQQDQQKDNQDQQDDQQQDQQDQQQNKDEQQDQKDEEQPQQQDQQPQQQQPPQQQDISKQDAERMLEALKEDENKTLDKVRQQQMQRTRSKSVDKDW
ncbi:MAG: tetratricopeptide repeat protein [Bacteroidales bacterium]